MNEQNRLELEKWDYFKTPYCPLTGISETLYRLYAWASANGQEDYFTKNDRKVMKILRKCYKKSTSRMAAPRVTVRSCGDRPPCTTPTSRPGRRTAGASTSS